MIASFHDEPTTSVWEGRFTRKLPNQIQAIARRKLRMLNAAQCLEDLRIPPANHLEALSGDRAGPGRAGQHSIRINNQWRLCFILNQGQAERVEIRDYH